MKKYKRTIGDFGETLAKNFLIARGYAIVASNVKIGYGELDIVANKDGLPVFVEVKTLASDKMGPADEALRRNQIKTIHRTINHYCRQYRINKEKTRLDFIAINLNRKQGLANIKHYKDVY